jgi:hypothetical protein
MQLSASFFERSRVSVICIFILFGLNLTLIGQNTVSFRVNNQPASGSFRSLDAVTVQILTTISNPSIYYTTNGTSPGFNSTLYSSPFAVTSSVLLRAIAYNFDFSESATAEIFISIEQAFNLTLVDNTDLNSFKVEPTGTRFFSNTVVRITRVTTSSNPNEGIFLGWGGDVSGDSDWVEVRMDRDHYIEAVFGRNITIETSGNGRVIQSTPNPIPYGRPFVLTAVPDEGFYFAAWGGGIGPSNPLINPSRTTFFALFDVLPEGYATVVLEPEGWGYVITSPPANLVTNGTKVKLTARTFFGNTVGYVQNIVQKGELSFFDRWKVPGHARNGLVITANGRTIFPAEFKTFEFHRRRFAQKASTPSIAQDGAMHLSQYDRTVVLNPDGTRKWESTRTAYAPSLPALDSQGNSYVLGERAFRGFTTDGRILFAFDSVNPNPPRGGLPAPAPAALIGHEGTVYAQLHGAAIAIRNRVESWRVAEAELLGIGPSGDVYYLERSPLGPVTIRRNSNGQIVWERRPLANSGPFMISDQEDLIVPSPGQITLYSSQGIRRWFYNVSNEIRTYPVIAPDGIIYFASEVGSTSCELHALKPTGELLWKKALPIFATSLIIAKSGLIYVCGAHDYIQVDRNGIEQGSFTLDGITYADPTLDSKGTFYTSNDPYSSGDLIWFDLGTPVETRGWPMLNQNPQRTRTVPPFAAPARITVQLASPSQLNFAATGTTGVTYVVEGSSNLTQWQPIHTFTGSTSFSRIATLDYEFYRVRSVE